MKLKNKTIIVTGGADGIGKALVLELLKRGAKPIAVDINQVAIENLRKECADIGKSIQTELLNIADRNAVLSFSESIRNQSDGIDGIINNAGVIQPFVRINQLDFKAIERVMNVNFYGAINMIKAFLPDLLKREQAHITNISSMGGFLPVPGQSVYGASKAAVKLLTEALYAELMETNVRVTLVFPGAIGTNITENSGVKAPNMGNNEKEKQKFNPLPAKTAAQQILNAMEQDKIRVYVGKDASMMNFLYRLSPGFATKFISKKMRALLSDS
ncbi:MAG: SDR family NAD(P)-dependent oxidoreductase [Flavobacteriales bacterium]